MSLRPALPSLAALTLLTVACGPSPRPRGPTDADLRSFTEAEAQQVIGEELAEAGVSVSAQWPVEVGAQSPFEVDIRLAQSDFGIEWVSPQDRHDHGDRIPEPDPSGQLRIMPGLGDDAAAQVLVLESTSYRYDPDLERVQRGSIGAAETESRLRRDVRDFLQYVRGQGGL